MESEIFKNLIVSEGEDFSNWLKQFLNKYEQRFTFPELSKDDLRKKVWSVLLRHLETPGIVNVLNCLRAVRILSRDKSDLNELVTERFLEALLRLGGLQHDETKINVQPNYPVMIESLKCLCNIVFNSPVAQAISARNGTVEEVVTRLRTYGDPEIPHDVKYFDMKLLFLITALCAETRPKLKDELHGLTYLIETLDLLLKQAAGDSGNDSCVMDGQTSLSDAQVLLACEILKVLFNLTVKTKDDKIEEEEEAHYLRLVTVLHDLLLTPTQSPEKRIDLHSNIINLLTSLPNSCFKELITSVQNEELPKELEYDGNNMEAVHSLLEFLKGRLEKADVSSQNLLLSPVLTVLLKCATSDRAMRKYLRVRILPPLKDVHNRPEQGATLRNHLCRLLTTPISQIKDLAAEFLFVLCKENVGRMIKYTGYGNAAGLFASRGLMGGRTTSEESRYSSDSEDSDTDEYKEFKHGINPVMGCYEPPHPNPMAGMSDEQKEYEAMNLVRLIDDLQKTGIVQPCRIGEDGRPEPIEHVLQLQDELPRQQVNQNTENQ